MVRRYGLYLLLAVCLGWFAYQQVRPAPQDDPDAVVIWSGWGEESPAFELYHQWWAELEREKGIRVSHVSLKNSVMIQQANRALVLGGAPALFQSFGGYGLALQGKYGLLENIYPQIERRGWDQVLDKKWLDIVTFDGEFYGIPIEAATFGIIVNTTLFDRHGIEYPTDWPTFVRACEAFKARGIQPLLIAGKEEGGGSEWVSILHMRFATGEHYTAALNGRVPFKNEPLRRAFDTFKSFYRKGYFGNDLLLGVDQQTCLQYFYQGEGAMLFSGNWEAWGAIHFAPQFDYRMFHFPRPPDGQGSEWDLLGGSNTTWVVPKNSPKLEASLAYLDMLVDYDRLKALAEKIYYVPLKEAYLDSSNHPLHLSIADRAQEAQRIFYYLSMVTAPAVARVYQDNFMAYALGKVDFDQACERIQAAIDRHLVRQRRRAGL